MFFTDHLKAVLLCGSFLLFMFRVNHAFLSVHCSLVVTCWERVNLLALVCVMFYCVFVTFPYVVLGQVWYLIVSISDLCLLNYFVLGLNGADLAGHSAVVASRTVQGGISHLGRSAHYTQYARTY